MPTRAVKVDAVRTRRTPKRQVCRPVSSERYSLGPAPSPSTIPTTQPGGLRPCSQRHSRHPCHLQPLKTPVQPKQMSLVTQPSPSASHLPVWIPRDLALKREATTAQAREPPPTLLHGSFRAQSGPTTTPANSVRVRSVWPAQEYPGCTRMELVSRLTPSPLR